MLWISLKSFIFQIVNSCLTSGISARGLQERLLMNSARSRKGQVVNNSSRGC